MKHIKEGEEHNAPQVHLLKRQKRNRLLLFFSFLLLIGIVFYTIYISESLLPLREALSRYLCRFIVSYLGIESGHKHKTVIHQLFDTSIIRLYTRCTVFFETYTSISYKACRL